MVILMLLFLVDECKDNQQEVKIEPSCVENGANKDGIKEEKSDAGDDDTVIMVTDEMLKEEERLKEANKKEEEKFEEEKHKVSIIYLS